MTTGGPDLRCQSSKDIPFRKLSHADVQPIPEGRHIFHIWVAVCKPLQESPGRIAQLQDTVREPQALIGCFIEEHGNARNLAWEDSPSLQAPVHILRRIIIPLLHNVMLAVLATFMLNLRRVRQV